MTRNEIQERIVRIIEPYVKDREALSSLGPQASILDDLGVNSARLVDIILALEDEFGIEIDDEDADRVRTIADAIDLVAAKAA